MVATSESPSVKDTYLNPLAAAKLLTSPAAGARAMRVPPPTRPGLGSTLESRAGRFRKGNPISQEASGAFAYTSRTLHYHTIFESTTFTRYGPCFARCSVLRR